MDLRVYPGTRIARMPKLMRPAAVLVRNVRDWTARFRRFAYEADGLGTDHFLPFVHDPSFDAWYAEMAPNWFQTHPVDARWRIWLVTRFARQCAHLDGNFAEFGVYRAGNAYMILRTVPIQGSKFFLFDTFRGTPGDRLTDTERARGFEGRLADTSPEYVASFLKDWESCVEIVAGDIFETLGVVETGALSFVHVDLNATAPTVRALEYAYPRVVSRGVIVLDDYGWSEYEDQRIAIEAFFDDKVEEPIALPTGQAFVVKA